MLNGKSHYFDWAMFNGKLVVYQRIIIITVTYHRTIMDFLVGQVGSREPEFQKCDFSWPMWSKTTENPAKRWFFRLPEHFWIDATFSKFSDQCTLHSFPGYITRAWLWPVHVYRLRDISKFSTMRWVFQRTDTGFDPWSSPSLSKSCYVCHIPILKLYMFAKSRWCPTIPLVGSIRMISWSHVISTGYK